VFAPPSQNSDRRGQALVEMAIVLPLLAILLVMAVDAGRLFFGWVALQNSSRIGADYAAAHADAWDGPPNAFQQDQLVRYQVLVRNDMQALGCQDTSQFNPVPAPNFDIDGDGTSVFTDGALVRVELDCDFGLLTPLAESFLGAPLTLHSKTDFAINRTYIGGLPAPGVPPPPPPPGTCVAPDFDGPAIVRRNSAQALWDARGFTEPLAFQGPNGNWVIGGQTPLEGGQSGPCSMDEIVSNVPI